MRHIFKNYLKTFIKNWIQTLGTILFILLMVTIVVGMLAGPLQINSIANNHERKNRNYDSYLKTNNLSNDFLYKYMYLEQPYSGANESGQNVQIISKSQYPVLSPVYKKALDEILQNSGSSQEVERAAVIGRNLNFAIRVFREGSLINLQPTLELTNGQGQINNDNLNLIVNNLANLLVEDAKLSIDRERPLEAYGSKLNDAPVLVRLAMKMFALFNNNNFDFDLASLMEAMESGSGGGIGNGNSQEPTEAQMRFALQTLLDQQFRKIIAKTNNRRWSLSTYELFSPELYTRLARKEYSYDFLAYLFTQIFTNVSNKNLYDESKGWRYEVQSQKSIYYALTTTDSFFPKFAIEIKTATTSDRLNQLQLENGREAKTMRFSDFTRRQINEPEIVVNSAYVSSHGLNLGDSIEIPVSAASNNISPIKERQAIDNFLVGSIRFQIVGEGSTYDELVPGIKFTPFLQKIDNYSNGYIDDDIFWYIRQSRWNFTSVNENAFWTKYMFKNLWNSRDNIVDQLTINQKLTRSVFLDQSIVTFSSSPTLQKLNRVRIMVIVYIILGVAVLILAFIFINFIIKKELNETRRQIGIFKSFGYKISELSWIFAIKTFLTIFVGIVLGLIFSIPLQLYTVANYINSIMFYYSHIYTEPIFLLFVILVIPLIFLATSYFLTLIYLKEPTLSLLYNTGRIPKKTKKASYFIRKLSEKNKAFGYRLQRAFVQRSLGKFIVVQTLFSAASLAYTLMFGAQTLLAAVVNQGFATLNAKTDHEFSWTNPVELDIPLESDRFNLTDIDRFAKQNFRYNAYNGQKSFGDSIAESKNTSDSRYRISFLVDSYANEFEDNRKHALDLLIPTDYYIDKYTYQPNNPLTGDKAVKFTAKDYYLNWFFTLKIDQLTKEIVNNVMTNHHYNFGDIEKFSKDHPGARVDLTPALGGDPASISVLQKELKSTILGLMPLNDQGLKNNLYLHNITKIIVLQAVENNLDSQITRWLTTNGIRGPNGRYSRSDVERALAFAKNSKIAREFSPNNQSYWGLATQQSLRNVGASDSGAGSNETNSGADDEGLSLSKLPPSTFSLILSALVLAAQDANINNNSVITMNELFYNQDTEFLTYDLLVSGADRSQTGGKQIDDTLNLRLFDSRSSKYGVFENLLTYKGVTAETYHQLGDDVLDPKTINGILPYGLAKTYNLHVGDTLTLQTNTIRRERINIKIIGINEAVSFHLGAGWPIDIDFGQFRSKFFNPELNSLFESGLPIFNKLYSQEPLLIGDIDVLDISKSLNSMKYVGKNIAMSIQNNASVFGSIFNGMLDFTRMLNIQIDSNYQLVTNPNVASTSRVSGVLPYNILRTGADNVVSTINNTLILFMVLLAILLVIILVVVMNIVVEEAGQIILTLRAIGYSPFEVNWIVMGSYIIGALFSFIIAYVLSIIIWLIFLQVVGNLTHIYVFMEFSWQAPVITFLVIGSILFVGWVAANTRVNKTPLPRITNFA